MMWKIMLPVIAAVLSVGSAALVGGWRDISNDDEGMRSALNSAVVEHNRRSNDMYLSQVSEVVKAQSQVVSGIRYRITVRMGKTPCRKGSVSEVCAVHQDPEQAQVHLCTFTMWSQPWLSRMELVKQEC
ncbi:cystatin C (amyloid angiopathy and cerebral hemorrhage) [Centropristis striata]|uniref:cystatin C (amyloid angiopathy and cerebral hemorrhage) n=1 Tax=Centropristis striata TaxID=184440 RepID=UPI0027E0EF9B|nr:cystatin C (amyloid angiopathy and cerebral hemorrhage) [Centropristis striata]